MSERTYEGKLVGDRDGFEATASNTFHLIRLVMGKTGEEFTLDVSEAEAFAKWVLSIQPYGFRRIG